jgi:hypothetical protein
MSMSAARLITAASLLFLAVLCAAAQAVETPYTVGWTAQLGTPADDQAHAVGVDAAGNVYMAGYTKGALAEGPNAGGYDAFLAKYNASGVLQWTSQFGSTSDDCARGLTVDAAGNAYVTGYTYGNLAGRVGNYDAFLAKFDTNGANQWTRQLGTTAADMAYGITLDAAGAVYLTGDTKGNLSGTSAGSNDAHLIKYNADGDWQWSRQLGGTLADYSYAVTASGSGIFIAGYTAGTLPGQTSLGNYDAYVARYDADGNLAWTRQLGTPSTERGYSLAADGHGGVYLAGQTDGAMNGNNAGDFDLFLTRIDPNGSSLWTRQAGTPLWDRAMAVTTDGAGGVYLTGETNGSLAAQSAGYADMILLKYTETGDALWSVQLGTPSQDEGHAIAADGAGRIYVAGLTLGDLAGTGSFGSIDAVLVQFVPEPGCLALLVVALAGLARRRRSVQ